MKILFTILFILALQFFAYAEDDCTYNFAGFQSPLDTKHYTVKNSSLVARDEGKKNLQQDLTLENGIKVDFRGGGCAHMAFAFTYSGYKQKPKNLDELLYLALSLMVEAPTTQTDSLKPLLINKLTANNRDKIVKSAKDVYRLPCGDATCNLDASVPGKISVSYDFAL